MRDVPVDTPVCASAESSCSLFSRYRHGFAMPRRASSLSPPSPASRGSSEPCHREVRDRSRGRGCCAGGGGPTFGVTSLNSSKVMRPAGLPPMSTSKKTLGLAPPDMKRDEQAATLNEHRGAVALMPMRALLPANARAISSACLQTAVSCSGFSTVNKERGLTRGGDCGEVEGSLFQTQQAGASQRDSKRNS